MVPSQLSKRWYVSYAWKDDTPGGCQREEVVDGVCERYKQRGITILRDKEQLRLGDSINAFMQQIGKGDRIFVILSDKYLRSLFCMGELVEVWKNCRREEAAFRERVRPYQLPDAEIRKSEDRIALAGYWEGQWKALEAKARLVPLAIVANEIAGDLAMMHRISSEVTKILGILADMVLPRTLDELERYGLDDGVPGGGQAGGGARNADDRQRQKEQSWKEERKKHLEETIINLLKGARKLMEELEREAPVRLDDAEATGTNDGVRAQRIFDRLMRTEPFGDALDWLFNTYQTLAESDRASRTALAEICKFLLPWLYIACHNGRFDDLARPKLGDVVSLDLGLHCFAEIVSAGLEARAAEFVADADAKAGTGSPAERRGGREIAAPPVGGPEFDIEDHLRMELFKKVGVRSEFRNAAPETKDRRINARLEALRDGPSHTRFYFTFYVSDYQRSLEIFRNIAGRYPALAVIKLNEEWSESHDSWWIRMSHLLGFGA